MTVKRPYVLAAGLCGHALDDLPLQHEMHVGDRGALRQQMKQQRRRNVVGKIADDAQRRTLAAQAHEVGVEHVFDVDSQVRLGARIGRQRARQITIDLDHIQDARRARSKLHVRAPRPGPDLHDALAVRRRDGIDDAADDARIVQKMLTEALTNQHRQAPDPTGGGRLANSIASASAARRLPASALPVRANDSAVP